MSPSTTLRGHIAYAGQLSALSAAYILFGKLGLSIAPVGGFATLIWPPTGLSLAALVLGGYRLWPAVVLGAFVTNLWTGAPPLVACGMAVGNTLEAVAGTCFLRLVPGFGGTFDRLAEVIGLAVPVGIVSTAVSATIGTLSLSLGGIVSTADLPRTWSAWWTGNLVSALVIAPWLLTLARGERVGCPRATFAEAAAIGTILMGCAALVFAGRPETATTTATVIPYVLFVPLIWAAVRFGPRGAANATFAITVAAVSGTYAGRGMFARADEATSLLALHGFLASTSLVSLVLGSLVAEHERLHQARAWLAAIVESSADAVIGKSLDGTVTSWNASAQRMYGYAPEEVLGKPIATLVPPELHGELQALRERVGRGERILNHESFRRRKDGTTIEVAASLSPIRDSAGVVVGISSVARDITEHRRIERELRESEERQRLAVEAAHLGIWCWDVKNDGLAWTPECKRLHGLAPDEDVTLARLFTLLHPDDRARTQDAIRRALDERSDYMIEHRVVWTDGSVHWARVLGRAFYDEGGAPDRMMGVTMDITAQKREHDERAHLLERERSARAEAEAATRAKDEFLAVLSHELRTPLQSMLGWTRILRARRFDERTDKGLETIERNARAQARLIEDLLDVSRIVAGKLRVSLQRVDLASVVMSALDSAKAAAGAKSIGVDATVAPLADDVLGDPDRLQQIMSNLLSNAVKFTPHGGHIGVRLECDGTAAAIRVEDNGRGISADFLPRVFDRFRQEDSTSARSHGGLGLGLAIVRHLVEMHGGTVSAESPGEGLGAAFTVRLPLVERGQATVLRRALLQSVSGAPVPLHGVRVLLVDDDLDTRELLATLFREAGADVCAVSSARAALTELPSFAPHVMLADIGMPEEDGYSLIRRLRARESTEGGHVPAIALTSFASQADCEHAIAVGFDAHIAKPASPGALTRTVESLVARVG